MKQNPLLTSFTPPPFTALPPEQRVPAVEQAIQACRDTVTRVLAEGKPYRWATLCQPLSEAENRLQRVFSAINHLNTVISTPEIRASCEACQQRVTDYRSWLGQHEELSLAWQQLRDGEAYTQLSPAQQRVVDNTLRDFWLAGVALDTPQKLRYTQINARLAELLAQFANNELDATMAWSKNILDEHQLAGLPASVIALLRNQARERGLPGWLLTLTMPCYLPVMTWAEDRGLREEIYRAWTTRASDSGPDAGRWDNSETIDEILALRHEMAQLLGLPHYARQALVPRMVDHEQQVTDFLLDIARRARPKAEQQLQQLRDFAQTEYGVERLQAWDISWYSEQQKQRLYAISDEQIRPYFPEERVLKGLFAIIQRLFGVTAQQHHGVEVWHPDVRFYTFNDASGEPCGAIYLDLYAREYKRGGAWMDDCATRLRFADGSLQQPVAYVVCNFNRPLASQPALFTHLEVVTLFHEFGHALHHILTTVECAAVSGINGVPWDAIELPSQLLENWCWEPEALATISGHFQTGLPLPEPLLRSLLKARHYQAALGVLRHVELALFDLRLHSQSPVPASGGVMGVLQQVRREVAVLTPPEWGRMPHAFSHIFSGGYAAGYYSYLWANVLALDAFGRFQQEGVLNPEVGQAFLDDILSQGGSQDPQRLFRRFRGREPQLDGLLQALDIVSAD